MGDAAIPVLPSAYYPADAGSPATDSVLLLDQSAIVISDEGLGIDVSQQGTVRLGGGTMSSTDPSPAAAVSLFQTGTTAIRAELTTSWSQPAHGRAVLLSGIARG